MPDLAAVREGFARLRLLLIDADRKAASAQEEQAALEARKAAGNTVTAAEWDKAAMAMGRTRAVADTYRHAAEVVGALTTEEGPQNG